jgi:hypothetical protein
MNEEVVSMVKKEELKGVFLISHSLGKDCLFPENGNLLDLASQFGNL